MHIFTACHSSYILGLAALLKSIDLNLSKSGQDQVKLSIVTIGIDQRQKELLQSCCKYKIEWKEFQSNYDKLMSLSGSKLTYIRLEPLKYTGETERLIWIDCDTIVLGSLDPLWNLDLENMAVAAAPNGGGNPHNPQDKNPYLNGGVLVYNMKVWEEEQLSEKLMENAQSNLWGDYDQGALNSFLAGRWKKLDQIWNHYNTEDTSSTKVLHYMARPKPWESPTPHHLWLDMLYQTPFKDEGKKIPKKLNGLARFKIKYSRLGLWLTEPILKIKSYLKKKTR